MTQESTATSKPPFLVALDIGSGVGRCLIFDSNGTAVASTQKEWTRSWLGTDWDAGTAWQAFSTVTREAIRKAGIRSDEIAAVSSTARADSNPG